MKKCRVKADRQKTDARTALNLLRDMLAKGLPVDGFHYSTVLSALADCGRYREAKTLLESMNAGASGTAPNVYHFNSVITAFARGRRPWVEALEVFRNMTEAEVAPNKISYNTLITAIANTGSWEKALDVFQQMKTAGSTPDTITYSTLITAIATGAQWDVALAVYTDAVVEGTLVSKRLGSGRDELLDLHFLSSSIAVVTVLHELLRLWELWRPDPVRVDRDLRIITGRGAGSEDGKAVLLPVVLLFLNEGMRPRLQAEQDSSNPGCIRIRCEDLDAWFQAQNAVGRP